MNENFGIIIAAGGSGNRFGSNKLLENILNIPVFIYSIKTFLKIVAPNQIYFICPKDEIAVFANKLKEYLDLNIASKINFIVGGKTRVHSVSNGLNAMENKYKFIAVHDAARPLIKEELIIECFNETEKSGGAIIAKKVIDTIKQINDDKITKTVNRDYLCAAETPQCFNYKILKSGYNKILSENIQGITDDASVFELLNQEVKIVSHNQLNLKITYQDDIVLAENYLQKRI